ncbi:MAG: protein kinase [Planctomycetota bacterium]
MEDSSKTVIKPNAPAAGAIQPRSGVVPGQDLGGYHILRLIGSGGFGDVFLALHRVLRRQVALKVVHNDWLQHPNAVELFLREAQIVARFDHPNIVPVYDAGHSEKGVLYMAMRLVPGGDLVRLIEKEKPVPRQRALALMRDCCAGLAAIHNLGMVHRDIKTANILLESDGRACITDLGLASLQREGIPVLEKDGSVVGTPVYLAPERLSGTESAGPLGDLYALGITFVELLNGDAPFGAMPSIEILTRMEHGQMPKVQLNRSDLGNSLETLLREMTAPVPEERPKDIESVLRHVEALLAEAEDRAPYVLPPERATEATLAATHARLKTSTLLKVLLDSLPGPALALNASRQVVAANEKAAALLGAKEAAGVLGKRPGELLACRDARRGPDGCGTGPACPYCGLGAALSQAHTGKATPLDGECLLCNECGSTTEFGFRLNEIQLGDETILLLAMRDLSSEKRRQVLERSLVANLLDTADMVQALADSEKGKGLPAGARAAHRRISGLLSEASKALMEEAVFQQHLLAGEAGELQPLWAECPIGPLLTDVCEHFRRHSSGAGREVALHCPPELSVRTDRILLQRAVRDLVKNALEACAVGEKVQVEAAPWEEGGVEIRVHNPQGMPPAVRMQVFKRSFSTKAASGRGIGTHAARLFVEGALRGHIGFSSTASGGTTFWIRLPKRPPET